MELPYEISDFFCEGKKEGIPCEDRIVVLPGFVAVIDGATAKNDVLYDGKSSGYRAAECISDVLGKLSPQTVMSEAVQHITDGIGRLYEKYGIWEKAGFYPEYRFTASAVIYSVWYREVWIVGDCQALIAGERYIYEKEIDRLLSRIRASVIEKHIVDGYSIDEMMRKDPGRRYILPMLKDILFFQNNHTPGIRYVYAVFDGFPVLYEMVKCIKVPKNTPLILTSDGYPHIYDSFEQTKMSLQTLLRDDPLCFKKFKSTKGMVYGNRSFDDRSFIRILHP
ncbi:hypothetical protein [Coprobacter tertius]|uniref:Protein phosphatase 2C n=1 Tax=Coprobacter tertius TaxID=2944915 RepID=A0ABT1MJS6_9BACT|nr:hypothetical protein [Coprobacter tertius]MCP9612875.1 hypothetical protein [Coprobacter tertius]